MKRRKPWMEKDQSKLAAVPRLAFALIALLMLCTFTGERWRLVQSGPDAI